jgi:hypothetical protein
MTSGHALLEHYLNRTSAELTGLGKSTRQIRTRGRGGGGGTECATPRSQELSDTCESALKVDCYAIVLILMKECPFNLGDTTVYM